MILAVCIGLTPSPHNVRCGVSNILVHLAREPVEEGGGGAEVLVGGHLNNGINQGCLSRGRYVR
jgi:hypothetical protein